MQDTERRDTMGTPAVGAQAQNAQQPATVQQPTMTPQTPTVAVADKRRPRGLRTGAILLLTALLVVVFGTGLFAGWEFGRNGVVSAPTNAGVSTTTPGNVPTSDVEATREQVIANVRPAVVQINVATQEGQGLGSGVIIDKRGYIVTNNHVVEGAQQVQVVLYDGVKVSAQVVGTSAPDDLAVLKIAPRSGMTVATLGDSSKLRVGQEVLAIGNPLGITQTVTNGIVSALDRNVDNIPGAIQTDAPINPGNSGGALVDLSGKLIGIPTATAIDPQFRTPANGVGFAIPANRVQFIVPQIIEDGRVTNSGRAALGVNITSVDATLVQQNKLSVDRGAYIVNVTDGGPAAQAGLRAGDVIVQVAGKEVNDASELGDVLMSKRPGDTVAVSFYRGAQQQNINVRLGELQAR
jgi:S1-C subfamily serine protease